MIEIEKNYIQHAINNIGRKILNKFSSVFQKNSGYKIIHKNYMEKITSMVDIVMIILCGQ